MPEQRRDPITGRISFIAENRAGRPTDFGSLELGQTESLARGLHQETCPFCAGHEAATPHELATVHDAEGRWLVRVVPNKYPAVTTPLGVHEIVIESPQHALDLTELDLDQLILVVRMYRDRIRHWAADPKIKHVIVFKNSGFPAGASLEHVHSQLVALPIVPDAVQAKLDAADRLCAVAGRCPFCDLAAAELAAGQRIVLHQHGFLAACAYAPRQPFETWILPEPHAARFESADDAQIANLAAVFQTLLRRLHATCPSRAYNLILHSGPLDGSHAESFHWHWELIPRTTQWAGLEIGAGGFICPVSPEKAAALLRG